MRNKKNNIQKEIIKEFNLPGYVKNKSFADASKAIDNKFKDRQDVYATKTKEELLERLANAQEYIKMKEQSSIQSNGSIPNKTQMAGGGIIGEGFSKDATAGQQGDAINGIVGMGAGVLDLGNMAFGKTGIDTTGNKGIQEKESVAGGAIGGALKGASAGAALGPWGAAGGAIIGGAAGIIGGSKANKDILKANVNAAYKDNLQYDNDFANGGYVNGPGDKDKDKDKKNSRQIRENLTEKDLSNQGTIDRGTGLNFSLDAANTLGIYNAEENLVPLEMGNYKGRNYFDIKNQGSNYIVKPTKGNPQNAQGYNKQLEYLKNTNPNAVIDGQYLQMNNRMADGGFTDKNPDQPIYQDPHFIELKNKQLGNNKPIINMKSEDMSNVNFNPSNNGLNNTIDWLGQNYGDILSYTPVVGNLFDKLDKPNTARGNRLTNRYERQLFDETALENKVNQNNLQGALSETSGGDLGALRTNMIAGNLNKTKALSDAYLRGSEVNRSENRTAQEFNANIDRTNLGQEERYIERKARDTGAYNTAKAAKTRALLEDLGNIGREESNKKVIKKLYGYTWDGRYYIDDKGKKYTEKDMKTKLEKDNIIKNE